MNHTYRSKISLCLGVISPFIIWFNDWVDAFFHSDSVWFTVYALTATTALLAGIAGLVYERSVPRAKLFSILGILLSVGSAILLLAIFVLIVISFN